MTNKNTNMSEMSIMNDREQWQERGADLAEKMGWILGVLPRDQTAPKKLKCLVSSLDSLLDEMGTLKESLVLAKVTQEAKEKACVVREYELANRHGEVASLEAALSKSQEVLVGRETALRTRQEELASREATLHQREEEMAGLEASLKVKHEELARREATLHQRDEEVASQEATLKKRQEEQASSGSALRVKQEELASREAVLGDQEEELAGQGATLKEKQKELASREATFEERREEQARSGSAWQEKLTHREAALDKRAEATTRGETSLQERVQAQTKREEGLARQEASLRDGQLELTRQTGEHEARDATLVARAQEWSARDKDLMVRSEALTGREAALATKEGAVAEKEEAVIRRATEQDARDKDLVVRSEALTGREAALVTTEVTLADKEKVVAERQKSLQQVDKARATMDELVDMMLQSFHVHENDMTAKGKLRDEAEDELARDKARYQDLVRESERAVETSQRLATENDELKRQLESSTALETSLDILQGIQAINLWSAKTTMDEARDKMTEVAETLSRHWQGEQQSWQEQVRSLERQVDGEAAQAKRLQHDKANLRRAVNERDEEVLALQVRIDALEAPPPPASAWETVINKAADRWRSFVPFPQDDRLVDLEKVADYVTGMTTYEEGGARFDRFLAGGRQDGVWHCFEALCHKGHEDEASRPAGPCDFDDDEHREACLQVRLAGTGEGGKPKVAFRFFP